MFTCSVLVTGLALQSCVSLATRVRAESTECGKRCSLVYWLERWPCKAESDRQWWFEPSALSVVSGVITLMLASLPEKNSVAYIWACLWLESI